MGLDQKWLARSDANQKAGTITEHRNIPALEAFMASQWRGEGDFNGKVLNVTPDILDLLQCHCVFRTLDKNASGFFWGEHDQNSHYTEISKAVSTAKKAISDGKEVFYTSLW